MESQEGYQDERYCSGEDEVRREESVWSNHSKETEEDVDHLTHQENHLLHVGEEIGRLV